MNVRTFESLQDLKAHLGLAEEGLLLEPDLDIVEHDCDWFERKRRDAEVLCTLAANLSGPCLEIGTSYGRTAFNLGTNLQERGTVYTVNILPEQFDSTAGELVTHLLPKEQIGSFYRSHGLKNIVQLYANTARWEVPAEIDQLAIVFVDGAHDTQMVTSDSKLAYERIREGGYLLWHDFSPELRRKHSWIDSAMCGAEKFLAERGLADEPIFHLRDSWIGLLKKPNRASKVTGVRTDSPACATADAALGKRPRILLGYGAYADESSVRDRYEAWLARLRGAGFDVTGTCLTLNPPGPCLTWPELDTRWKRRDPELLALYDRLHRQSVDYDVFVNFNGINLHPEFVPDLPTFNIFSCFDDPENSANLSRPVATAYDLCLVGNIAEVETYRKWGVRNARFWPLGFYSSDKDPSLTRERILSDSREVDLALVCERLSPWRKERCDRIGRAFPTGVFRGPGWPGGYLSKQQTLELYRRTRIGLNLHNSSGPINFRTYELPANGVMQICDNKSHLAGIFDLNKEVVGFDTIEEGIDLCRYYLAHEDERRTIAAAGWERALRDYNEEAVFTLLERYVGEVKSSRSRETPPICAVRCQPVAELHANHRTSHTVATHVPAKPSFQSHQVEWNDEKVGRFWDYMSSSFVGKEEYFSRQVGQGIANFLSVVCPRALAGAVLDFGCGPGFLLEHLGRSAGTLWGSDSSPDSLAAANSRMRGNSRWGGAITSKEGSLPLPAGELDLITCVETIEHVLEPGLPPMLNELHRLLRPGLGLLLVTTPFEERLEMSEVFCPDCGASFHRWQHQRQFGVRSLCQLIESHRFATQLCVNLNFADFQTARFCDPNSPVDKSCLPALLGRGPHLIWLGKAV